MPSLDTSDTLTRENSGAQKTEPPPPRRINVAINSDILAAIDHVIEREQVSLTEAVRRLIGYGDYVYRAARDENATLVIHPKNGKEREVVLV
jgi:Ribbon-helix-helix protein, copG family